MVISHLMQSSKELIKANSNILDNIIKCVNAFTTTKINASGNDILKGSLILFLGKISVADGKFTPEEQWFLSELFDIPTAKESIEKIIASVPDYNSVFDLSTMFSNSGISKLLPPGTPNPNETLYACFEGLGTFYVSVFPDPAQIEKYNNEIQHVCELANQDKSINPPLKAKPFDTSKIIPNALGSLAVSSSVPAYVPVSSEPDSVKNEQDPMEDLNELIGLDSIKKDVTELIGLVKMMKMRESRGMKSVPLSLHLVFTGNPGTGKTSVARILARLYKQIGVLKNGQLVEVDRSELVAGYVGQTALKTQQKINEAIGGILFIDEAYTLAKEGNDFGQEAIDTILKEMEDKRGQFVVIVAGYSTPMKKFIESNPGLKSRFNKYFHFPDYTEEELVEIFDSMCQKYDYKLTDEAKQAAKQSICNMVENKSDNFANARDVRNFFERIITRQAGRVSQNPVASEEEMTTITMDDMPEAAKSIVRSKLMTNGFYCRTSTMATGIQSFHCIRFYPEDNKVIMKSYDHMPDHKEFSRLVLPVYDYSQYGSNIRIDYYIGNGKAVYTGTITTGNQIDFDVCSEINGMRYRDEGYTFIPD